MDKKKAKERIEKLKEEINKYRYAYHVLNKSLISDAALDSLKKELFDLENQFPEFITSDSPTQRVGSKPLKEFKKVTHEEPMLSFNDAFSEEDMKAWLERLENYLKTQIPADSTQTTAENSQRKSASSPRQSAFYCELKIDGLAIELVYENDIFVQGSTRGDGLIGEDVTQNLKTIEAIPLKLLKKEEVIKNLKNLKLVSTAEFLEKHWPKRLVVRGEVFLTKKEFQRINQEQIKAGLKLYANPRNIAAGSIRQLDPKITASRRLDSFQYEIVTNLHLKTHEEKHLLLKAFGFKTNPHNQALNSLEEVFDFRNQQVKRREELSYEIDGIVVIVNDNEIFQKGGVVGKAPRAAIAYKFSPREATTQVLDIKVQVGRTGTLTPVAVLKPVEVGGVKITHATLHNWDQIKRLGLKIGDTVIVSRAGDVIPQISQVLKDLRTGREKEFKMPQNCPIDNSKVVREGALFRCSNPKCGARHREFLKHFVSKTAFDIRGLGGKIIDRFLDEGLISDAADIFALKEGDIAVLERFGEKSSQNIVKEIKTHQKTSLSRFIYSLGILHVGEETALLLARQFSQNNSQKIIKPSEVGRFFQNYSLEKFQEISDIGPKVSQSIFDWFKSEKNINFLEKLEKVGVEIATEKPKAQSSKLKGFTFVLTGTLKTMSREEAKERIRTLGGEILESVSKKTSFVVVGEEPGSKYGKAKQLGIKIINERKFLEMIEI